jgi:hypothetical protein
MSETHIRQRLHDALHRGGHKVTEDEVADVAAVVLTVVAELTAELVTLIADLTARVEALEGAASDAS